MGIKSVYCEDVTSFWTNLTKESNAIDFCDVHGYVDNIKSYEDYVAFPIVNGHSLVGIFCYDDHDYKIFGNTNGFIKIGNSNSNSGTVVSSLLKAVAICSKLNTAVYVPLLDLNVRLIVSNIYVLPTKLDTNCIKILALNNLQAATYIVNTSVDKLLENGSVAGTQQMINEYRERVFADGTTIYVNKGDHNSSVYVEQICEVLDAFDNVYLYNNEVSYIKFDTMTIVPYTVRSLSILLDSIFNFVRDKASIPCPTQIAECVLYSTDKKLKRLKSVSNTPLLLKNGDIIMDNGYHKETGIYVKIDLKFRKITDFSFNNAAYSKRVLLDVIRKFPFKNSNDRAAALSMILTCAIRKFLDEDVPMFFVDAAQPNTGKTLLCKVASVIGNGNIYKIATYSGHEQEQRKLITSLLRMSPATVCFDNVSIDFGDDITCSMLTNSTWEDRELAKNNILLLNTTNTVWMVNGNNVVIKGDIGERLIYISLDSETKCVDDADKFLLKVKTNWTSLYMHCLTLLSCYIHEGAPKQDGAQMGGKFPTWVNLVSGCLKWIDAGDPCLRIKEAKSIDPQIQTSHELLSSWYSIFGSKMVLLRHVMDYAENDAKFRRLINDILGNAGHYINSKSFSAWCRKHKDISLNGYTLKITQTSHSNAHFWMVLKDGEKISRNDKQMYDPQNIPDKYNIYFDLYTKLRGRSYKVSDILAILDKNPELKFDVGRLLGGEPTTHRLSRYFYDNKGRVVKNLTIRKVTEFNNRSNTWKIVKVQQ